jgi:WS/DGAT/MGAT family acyltransferase
MNIAALIELDPCGSVSPATITGLLRDRIGRVPRLLQRLDLPGWPRSPRWVDDARFDLDRQLATARWPSPGGRAALLDLAADLATRRLPRDRPVWSATLVLRDDGTVGALVIVLHHVLTDGLGGLAVLAALADPPDRPFPTRPAASPPDRPSPRPPRPRATVSGLRELGLIGRGRPRLAARTWLNVPTGPRRRVAVAEVPLADVVAAARLAGGTVNDLVLAAVTGALARTIGLRGPTPDRLVVSVPVSGRRTATAGELGNVTGVRAVAIPTLTDDAARLAAIVSLGRDIGGVPRASSSGPLGAAFRLLARAGLFRLFIDHQRFVHTFETNLRGPSERLSLAGSAVRGIVPITVTPGNVAVSFATLSYAATLGITVVADPDVLADPWIVATELSASLRDLTRTRF